MSRYQNSDLYSIEEKLVLEYADAMTRTPVAVSDILFGKLRSRFTDEQLVELTASLAWENYRARFDHAFGMESESFSDGEFCALPVLERPASEEAQIDKPEGKS